MRSRPARLTLSALAWFALGAAAFVAVQTQRDITDRRTALRTFEATAREAIDALGDVQTGQGAYVAAGQDAAEWAPKVTAYLQAASSSIDGLRASARSTAAGPPLLDASTALTQVSTLDRRTRASLDLGDFQAASDAVFGEAADVIASAVSNVDTALDAERQAADGFEQASRQRIIYAAAGAGALAVIVLALLALVVPSARTTDAEEAASSDAAPETDAGGLASIGHIVPPSADAVKPADRPSAEALREAAELCTAFNRVREAADLKALLERAATVMDARGLIVWLGTTGGADLRPVLAHGYSEHTLARIPTIARDADNPTADAYRTASLQVVKSRPNGPQGALAVPLLVADGCIGALTAEVRDRGEESEAVRAVATIVASQLASVLAATAEASQSDLSAQTAAR